MGYFSQQFNCKNDCTVLKGKVIPMDYDQDKGKTH